MANGIAHNFNNILGAIRGFVDMALADVPRDSRVNADLKKAIRGIEDAKELSNKMLIFSREHKRKPDKIKLHSVVKEALELFGASVTVPVNIRRHIVRRRKGIDSRNKYLWLCRRRLVLRCYLASKRRANFHRIQQLQKPGHP